MDEAEKYQQRLEAIAEKRRLQEEQDRAKREMEDERLRLQQLKRKSLRDQWLMEGPQTSPDSQSPRSPLWGSQAQEMDEPIDKSESQLLAEEEEKLKEQMEDGQTEAVGAAEAGADIVLDAVLQNGENNQAGFETADDKEKTDLLKETAAVLTNGQSELKVTTNHSPSEDSNPPTSNGPSPASEDEVSQRLEPELNLGEAPNVSIEEEEEEEGTLVMRAERVIITDEGDDAPEDLTAQEDQQETTGLEETPLKLKTDAGDEGEGAVEEVEEVVVTEVDPETFTRPEAQPQTEEEVTTEDVSTNETDSKAEEQDEASEEPQCQVDALEGATVAPVPVYSEVQTSGLTPKLEAEGDAEESVEPAEAALEAEDRAPEPGQFQEVPLVDPQERSRTEAEAAEQEPLLPQAKDPDSQAEISAAANSLSSIETPVPSRAGQGEETQAPKRKTCMCCSVM